MTNKSSQPLSQISHLPVRLAILLVVSALALLALTSLIMTFFGSTPDQVSRSADTPSLKVLVSILPQQAIVEAIGGDLVEVNVLVPAGYSPHSYELSVGEMTKVSQADLYFGLGLLGFERSQLSQLMSVNPSLVYVDTAANNQYRELEAHSHADEDDQDEEENHDEDEDSLDPHVWLVPTMVMEQAELIRDALIKAQPESSDQIEANYVKLIADLEALDAELAAAFAPIQGQTMLVYHPAFGYLADEYGFVQEYIEIEGKEPGPAALEAIINEARADGVRVIFVQAQFSTASAQAIAENIDGVVVEVNPLAPDYFANLRTLAQTISARLN